MHNGCCVVISVSFALIVYASCDLLHSWNSFLEEDIQMEVGRRPAACIPPLFLSPSLPATLPPSLPRRRIQLTSPQGKVDRRSYSPLSPSPSLVGGDSSHSKVDRKSCSTSPSLPPSLLLPLPPVPPRPYLPTV